jgi:hypothetical protein
MAEMVVLGEDDPTSLQYKIGLPALQLTLVEGSQRSKNTSRDEATDAQLRLPLKEEA